MSDEEDFEIGSPDVEFSDDEDEIEFELDEEEGEIDIEYVTSPTILDEQEIVREEQPESQDAIILIKHQQKKIIDISEACQITVSCAGKLLKYFKWDATRLYEKFFEEDGTHDKLTKLTGVVISNQGYIQQKGNHEVECPVCYDDFKANELYGLPCEHFFCQDCWKRYLEVQVKDGRGCILSPCPYQGCCNVLDESLVKILADPKDQELFERYLLQSFVNDNPKIKWCPGPDCGKAIFCEYVVENVTCKCGEKFCFKCQKEAHEPCSCGELDKWKVKEKSESETVKWLMVNTKICPKCKTPILKNGGCNHMTCGQCKHEFCWICLDDWITIHGGKTGGFYKCNRFNEDELKKKLNQGAIDEARAELEKYNHYFTRYAAHLNSAKFEDEMKAKAADKMKKLQDMEKLTYTEDVDYIMKGIVQLSECRRVLKYTYIYAYFLENKVRKELFEFQQEELEKETERLSGLLEEEDLKKIDKMAIINSTKSGKKRLDNMLRGKRDGF